MWCNRDFRLTVLAGGEAGFEHLQCPDQVGALKILCTTKLRKKALYLYSNKYLYLLML